jgi:hypothetical protein
MPLQSSSDAWPRADHRIATSGLLYDTVPTLTHALVEGQAHDCRWELESSERAGGAASAATIWRKLREKSVPFRASSRTPGEARNPAPLRPLARPPMRFAPRPLSHSDWRVLGRAPGRLAAASAGDLPPLARPRKRPGW